MSSKIFRAIWIVAVLVFLASLFLIMGTLYSYFSSVQRNQLRIETELAAHGVALSGEKYFNHLETENYRITWVDPEGNVLYDNEADAATMENHLEREEISKALNEGFGESTRHSFTLADQQFYAAKRLPDGSVLRMSVAQLSVWSLLFGFAPQICLIIIAALIISFILASRLAKSIIKPINEIDLEHPDQYLGKENFEEIEPLIRHISVQQAQLKQDQDEIEKAALIRQEFSANVSHELKTPLHAISGYAELLENGLVKEEDIKPFAAKIHNESSRMTKLIEDIIELTKLDNGGSEFKWENCDLYRIAENAVDTLEAAASEMDVTLSIKGESAPVTAVPHMLYSIAYNLCDNAIKYNHRGGRVDVSVSKDERSVKLIVKDSGIGIPTEEQNRIFERFYRVDKSRSRDVGGTGLGLSIIKHAVMIHNGKVDLESNIGEGTRFIVTIPNKPGESAAQRLL